MRCYFYHVNLQSVKEPCASVEIQAWAVGWEELIFGLAGPGVLYFNESRWEARDGQRRERARMWEACWMLVVPRSPPKQNAHAWENKLEWKAWHCALTPALHSLKQLPNLSLKNHPQFRMHVLRLLYSCDYYDYRRTVGRALAYTCRTRNAPWFFFLAALLF